MQLPTFGSTAVEDDSTTSPSLSPRGAMMYRRVPSWYSTRAMWHDRFGSYSMPTTVAGMSSLVRRKSIIR